MGGGGGMGAEFSVAGTAFVYSVFFGDKAGIYETSILRQDFKVNCLFIYSTIT